MRTQRLHGLLLGLVALCGCYSLKPPEAQPLSAFQVAVRGVYLTRASTQAPRIPLPVVQECSRRYGGEAQVPPEVRGTLACRYVIPRGDVEVDLQATAMGTDGNALTALSKPISFKVVPGDLTGDYSGRWSMMQNGVATITVRVAHLYAETRFWAEDAPPKPIFADGGVSGVDGGDAYSLPAEPAVRTYAAGASQAVWFEEPTLAKIQYPDGFDNRSSPFVGQFISVGKNPESGNVLKLDCPDDPTHDGQVSALVVTGIDPAGFFVTDLNACRMKEDLVDSTGKSVVSRIPEPDGFYPGTFASMYIYNYNYPDGLYQGDLLWTVAGSVQEFTSTTQITFASWSIREKVRLRPEAEWTKYLDLAKPVELNGRICGQDTAPFLTDALCGHNKATMKMESLESALVKLRNVRFPQVFTNCDMNANGSVTFFCEGKPDNVNWAWGPCSAVPTPDPDLPERTCNINCTIGLGPFNGQHCSERSTYRNFGQFTVELAGPGPLEANLDPSIPQRMKTVTAGNTSKTAGIYSPGTQVKVWCAAPVHYRFGGTTVAAVGTDPLLPANTLLEHTFATGENKAAFLAEGAAEGLCTLGENPRTRVNLTLTDVLPDLNVDCDPADPDASRARECVNLRAARYDIVGHLRHVQPARPRWMVIPRDADDVCCHPGPGLDCPKLIKPCAGG